MSVSGGEPGDEPGGDGGVFRLSMWTVYERPTDYPNSYVARRIEIVDQRWGPTLECMVSRDLGVLRAILECKGLTMITRDESDEPHVLETWL